MLMLCPLQKLDLLWKRVFTCESAPLWHFQRGQWIWGKQSFLPSLSTLHPFSQVSDFSSASLCIPTPEVSHSYLPPPAFLAIQLLSTSILTSSLIPKTTMIFPSLIFPTRVFISSTEVDTQVHSCIGMSFSVFLASTVWASSALTSYT